DLTGLIYLRSLCWIAGVYSCFRSCLFFFCCSRDPRDLHSFPTRRSSDLKAMPGPDHRASLDPGEMAALVRGIRTVESALGDGDRSEEHTSELQSRFDLVCRLLLEKKKRREIPDG